MASDLAETAVTGIDVQLCGDAHLLNFGLYSSPERTLMFDLNDFDETFRGPWEWDLKRLAASAVVAGRSAGLTRAETEFAASESVRRPGSNGAARHHERAGRLVPQHRSRLRGLHRTAEAGDQGGIDTGEHSGSRHAFSKLTEQVNGRRRIKPRPPLVVRLEDLLPHDSAESFGSSRPPPAELPRDPSPDHRLLMQHYRLVDVALKVVGTGSVGTWCFVALLEGLERSPALDAGQGGAGFGSRAVRRSSTLGPPG